MYHPPLEVEGSLQQIEEVYRIVTSLLSAILLHLKFQPSYKWDLQLVVIAHIVFVGHPKMWSTDGLQLLALIFKILVLYMLIFPWFFFFSLGPILSTSPMMGSDISQVFNHQHSVEQYTSPGGTAKNSVSTQIEQVKEMLKRQKE